MHSTKLPISVIIIAKNEADILSRCLNSIGGLAQEIIAVINDCTDNTRSVLESFGAQVYEHDWQGFVIQKNRAISYTKHEWILSIDADEEITPKMQREIIDFFANKAMQYSAVSFCRKTWLLDRWIKHGDWYPDRVIRLFNKNNSHFDGNYVHEKLIVDGQIYQAAANLLHYSFPSQYLFLRKNEAFTKYFIEANLGRKKFSLFPVVFRSFWKFFRGYFIKLGFLDGYPGFIIAIQQAYSTFFKYNMLLEHQLNQLKPGLDKEDE